MKNPAPTPSTRDRLIQTAMQLFWEKGYGSTSVADVLHAAGVNSGSLYHFFPGKQDLLLAVLDAYRAGIDPLLLAPAWKGVDDPIERVFALLARYRLGIVQTDCVYACPIGSLALEIHEPDPPVRKAIAANFKAWTDAVEACLVAAGPRLPRTHDRRAGNQLHEGANDVTETSSHAGSRVRFLRGVQRIGRRRADRVAATDG